VCSSFKSTRTLNGLFKFKLIARFSHNSVKKTEEVKIIFSKLKSINFWCSHRISSLISLGMDSNVDDLMDDMKDDGYNMPKKEIYEWKEITSDFFDSVKDLELGELLHYQLFGLFEAMSAIEMMDKKMDIGMIDGKEKTPLTFDIAVKVFFFFSRFTTFQCKIFFSSDGTTEARQPRV
jgi:hypothetical protein